MSVNLRRLPMLLIALAVMLVVLAWQLDRIGSKTPASLARSAAATSDARIEPSGDENPASLPDAALTEDETVADDTSTSAATDVHVPVDRRIEMLAAAAGRGDDRAACEVAAELKRCRDSIDGRLRFQEQELQQRLLDAGSSAVNADQRAAIFDALDNFHQRQDECRQVSRERYASRQDHLFQAARAGNVRAMAEFAVGESTNLAELVADPARYDRYRHHAPIFFERAFGSGEPMAALAILQLNVDVSNGYRGILPREWSDPELVNAFTRRVMGEIDPTRFAGPAASAAAISRADALYQRHFARSPAMARYIAFAQRDRQATRSGWSIERGNERLNALDDQHCAELKQ